MHRENHKKDRVKKPSVKVVDLFCGIGGMTYGFINEGLEVVAGIDIDKSCQYGFEKNNKAEFVCKDIQEVTAEDINDLYGDGDFIKVLIGCAPCQPFSKLNLKRRKKDEFAPLKKFGQLIAEIKPDIVSMENVKGLIKYDVFDEFLSVLKENNYHVCYEVVDTSRYGVPQHRVRLVLLASRLGEIKLIKPTHGEKNLSTVRKKIASLKPIKDGAVCATDPLHRARKLDDINKKRILNTPHDGGNIRSWSEDLLLKCHKKRTGKSYRYSVYGRMRWDQPAPTITTQCIGLGNGRFGHPKQNRAISLREAAILQTFPRNYRFYNPKEPLIVGNIARFIGNAVPVRLGKVLARSIKKHIALYPLNQLK